MAANKKYTSDYNAEGQSVGYARPLARTYGGPLDKTGFYATLDEAKTYAASADAYVGQIVNVIEDNNVTQYVIKNTAGDLKVLGGTIEFEGEVFDSIGVVTTDTDGSKLVKLNLNGSDPEGPENLKMDGTDLKLSNDISVSTVGAGTVNAGTVDADTVDADTVDATTVTADAVNAEVVSVLTGDATVNAGTVDAGKVIADTVEVITGTAIVSAGTVDASLVEADTINATTVTATSSVGASTITAGTTITVGSDVKLESVDGKITATNINSTNVSASNSITLGNAILSYDSSLQAITFEIK